MAGIGRATLATAIGCAILTASPAFAARLEVGKPAPNFRLTTFDGKKLSLSDLKGQVVVLNIWATWCGPCKVELPLLNGYYNVQKKYGLQVIGVTTEDSVPNSQLAPISKILDFPMARSFHDSAGYGDVRALPTNYVIDRAGVLRYAEAGAFTLDQLNAVLVPLLREPPPGEPADSAESKAAP